MSSFHYHIGVKSFAFLKEILRESDSDIEIINAQLKSSTGINNFFSDTEEIEKLLNNDFVSTSRSISNKKEFGDFQTNINLAISVCDLLKNRNIEPEFILEPTCGTGNFIVASVQIFKRIKAFFAIEIYKPYILQAKLNLLDYFLHNSKTNIPEIFFFNDDILDFDFCNIKQKISNGRILILGNPPWVTNTELSKMNSYNLPEKSNINNYKGLDALTGKGNFDICESITNLVLRNFSDLNGNLAFLIKNTVIKNLLTSQKSNPISVGCITKFRIDSKKEFNAAVDASLMLCNLNSKASIVSSEFDFYSNELISNFGWANGKFASNLNTYKIVSFIDGKSEFEWRQGVKHDCSKVMELIKRNGIYINGNNENVIIENECIYGLIKSSDLKNDIIDTPRKFVLITQKFIGEDTNRLCFGTPLTFNYLVQNETALKNRKSIIYKNRPRFSIFGIGNYSFMPYKVAISGLYKQTKFALVLPYENKPQMLDDTCYFIGFDNYISALISMQLLNHDITQKFLKSIVFFDSKRAIVKEILMRISIKAIIRGCLISQKYLILSKNQGIKNIALIRKNSIAGFY